MDGFMCVCVCSCVLANIHFYGLDAMCTHPRTSTHTHTNMFACSMFCMSFRCNKNFGCSNNLISRNPHERFLIVLIWWSRAF